MGRRNKKKKKDKREWVWNERRVDENKCALKIKGSLTNKRELLATVVDVDDDDDEDAE